MKTRHSKYTFAPHYLLRKQN